MNVLNIKNIKFTVLLLLLAILTYFINFSMFNFIKSGQYFNLLQNLQNIFIPVTLMTLILLVLSILVTTANSFKQSLLIIPAIILPFVPFMFNQNYLNIIFFLIIIFCLLLLSYLYKAKNLRELLVKFEPYFIMDTISRGFIFIYSLFALTILFLNGNPQNIEQINIGLEMSKIIKNPLDYLLESSLFTFQIQDLLVQQINALLVPYQQFFRPLLALFVFFYFRLIYTVSRTIFFMLINPTFYILKKTGFIKLSKQMVEKQTFNL